MSGVTTARGLARLYTALAGDGSVDGVRLVAPERLLPLRDRQSWSDEDRVMRKPLGFAQGFVKDEITCSRRTRHRSGTPARGFARVGRPRRRPRDRVRHEPDGLADPLSAGDRPVPRRLPGTRFALAVTFPSRRVVRITPCQGRHRQCGDAEPPRVRVGLDRAPWIGLRGGHASRDALLPPSGPPARFHPAVPRARFPPVSFAVQFWRFPGSRGSLNRCRPRIPVC